MHLPFASHIHAIITLFNNTFYRVDTMSGKKKYMYIGFRENETTVCKSNASSWKMQSRRILKHFILHYNFSVHAGFLIVVTFFLVLSSMFLMTLFFLSFLFLYFFYPPWYSDPCNIYILFQSLAPLPT